MCHSYTPFSKVKKSNTLQTECAALTLSSLLERRQYDIQLSVTPLFYNIRMRTLASFQSLHQMAHSHKNRNKMF